MTTQTASRTAQTCTNEHEARQVPYRRFTRFQPTHYVAILRDDHGFDFVWHETLSDNADRAMERGAQEAQEMTESGFPRKLIGVIPVKLDQTGPILSPKATPKN